MKTVFGDKEFPEGRKPDNQDYTPPVESESETPLAGTKETEDYNNTVTEKKIYKSGDIRNFGAVGNRTETSKEDTEKNFVDNEKMDRKGRMNMMRSKMRLTRKQFDKRPVETELQLKEHRMRAKTMKGLRILHASQVTNDEVQDEAAKVVIGADVDGLYPALEDMEVANICYEAVLKTSIKFSNIAGRQKRYIRMCPFKRD